MNFLKNIIHPTESKRTHSLYPIYKLEDNFFVRAGLNLVYYIVSIIPLPLKILLRDRFGYRYFGLMDYVLYMILIITGAFYVMVLTIVIAIFLLDDGFGGINPAYSWLVHPPILSIAFLIWITKRIWQRFKTELNKPIDTLPIHSYYPGDSKFLTRATEDESENQQSDTKYIKTHLEPKLCITIGMLVLPIDPLLGLYIFLMEFCLKIENWYETRERRMAVLDLTDNIYDSLWREHVYEKIKDCQNQKLPLETIYKELLSIHQNRNQFSTKAKIPENLKLTDQLEQTFDLNQIDKLLKKLK